MEPGWIRSVEVKRYYMCLTTNLRVTILLVAMIHSVSFVWSQEPAEASWTRMKDLHYGGTLLSVSDESISLQTQQVELRFWRQEVLRVSVRGGRRKSNALWGLVAGSLIGLTAGAIVDYLDDVDSTDPGSNHGKIGAALFGAGVGAAVGAAFPGYRTVYRTSQASPSSSRPAGNVK
jgi:hypothetical protein